MWSDANLILFYSGATESDPLLEADMTRPAIYNTRYVEHTRAPLAHRRVRVPLSRRSDQTREKTQDRESNGYISIEYFPTYILSMHILYRTSPLIHQ